MADVNFVQSVQPPTLAMVVPFLLRRLHEKATATKRQSAVIINNMSIRGALAAGAWAIFIVPLRHVQLLVCPLPLGRGLLSSPRGSGILTRYAVRIPSLDRCRQGLHRCYYYEIYFRCNIK